MSDLEADIAAYLGGQYGSTVTLHGVQRIAVGWSHETWLFDAEWDGQRLGMCLRRDPGNALLREMSDLATQFTVLHAPGAHRRAGAEGLLLRGRSRRSSAAPFLVMEKVPARARARGVATGRRSTRDAATRGVLPGSFTDALAAIHTADWRPPASTCSACRATATTSSAARSPSGAG